MTITATPVPRRTRDGERRRVELWTRTDPTWADQTYVGVVRRLKRLESAGWLDEFDRRSWGPCVDTARPPSTERETVVRNRVGAFREWARRTGRTLSALEATRIYGEGRMGAERSVVALPSVVLASYRDGALEWVTPNEDATGLHTAAEWVDAAERAAFGGDGRGDGDEDESENDVSRRDRRTAMVL